MSNNIVKQVATLMSIDFKEQWHNYIYASDEVAANMTDFFHGQLIKMLVNKGVIDVSNPEFIRELRELVEMARRHSIATVKFRMLDELFAKPEYNKRTRSVDILNESWAKSIEKQIAELREKVEGK